jgi:hypothetical protein
MHEVDVLASVGNFLVLLLDEDSLILHFLG